MISTDQVDTLLRGNGTVYGQGDEKVGHIGQIYLDDQTGKPEWLTVKTGLFGSGQSFVPLSEARVAGDDVHVPYDKGLIKDAPRVDEDQHLSQDEEQKLYSHYGLGYSDNRSDSGLPAGGVGTTGTTTGTGRDTTSGFDSTDRGTVGHDTSGPNTDDAMTRSEERLVVDKQHTTTGKARLRKYIVTERVNTTVPVSHDEVRLEREPITDANRDAAYSGRDLSEEEHEVVLGEDRVVVNKETVPVERVRLDKETVTENQQISEDVRKEQIEVDGDGTTGTGTTGTGTTGTGRGTDRL